MSEQHDSEKTAAIGNHDTPAKPAAPADTNGAGAAQNEVGGRGGLEPTRYGDWEKNGRCIDF